MCLSPKTGSYDQMPSTFQPIFHSIANETNFRASKLFFNELVLHHNNTKKKFLLYPRFIMQCIISELGNEVLVGKTEILKPLTSQAYSRHNKQAAWPEDDQGEPEPVPMEPSSSKPTPPKAKKPKIQKQKPTKPKRKAVQEVEMPEQPIVQSALVKDVTETSSQSHPSQTPPRAPITILFNRKRLKKTIPIDSSFETAEPTAQTTEPTPQISEPDIEIAKLLSGLKEKVPSTHVSPHQPHKTGDIASEIDMDVDTQSPNQRDEDEPESLSPNLETFGTFEAATTHLPPSGGPEDRSNIAKTSTVATTDERLMPEVGNPLNQEKEVHETTELGSAHDVTDTVLIEDVITDSDDSIDLDDDSQTNIELTAASEGPTPGVSKLKELVTPDQVKVHLIPDSPKVASSVQHEDHPKTHPSLKMPTQFPGSSSIDLNQLCSPDGPLYQLMNTPIANHLKSFTTALELSTKTQFVVINKKLGKLSNKIDNNSRQLAELTGRTSQPGRLPKVDEAKKGEKIKELKESLEARIKARVALQQQQLLEKAQKQKEDQQRLVSRTEVEAEPSQGHNDETAEETSDDSES